jgi:ketosteroid isomerase-like protein
MSRSTLDMLQAFADAWNRHDLAGIMALHTDDCEFWSSAGPHAEGSRYKGREAVAAAYQAIFDGFPDAQWGKGSITLLEGRGLSEWTFTGTGRDGKRVEVLGLDLLEIVGDKIRLKNSFRKARSG